MAMSANDATRRTERAREERGVTTLVVIFGLVALIAAAALAIDVGMIMESRTQLQNAADGAALAGARQLLGSDGTTVQIPAAQTAAVGTGASNVSVGNASLSIRTDPADMEFGRWDFASRDQVPPTDPSDPEQVDSIRVTARMDNVANGPLTSLFAAVLGRTGFQIGAEATAWVGFAGNSLPGNVAFPIAVDCCQLAGPDCQSDYCQYITTNPPNPCPLDDPQSVDTGDVSCLQFFATGGQNACWTQFSESDSSVNTNDMVDIIQDGTDTEISAGDEVFVDNGTKTGVVNEIDDRFQGNGYYNGNPSGTDRYAPFDGVNDSWVVGLPVIECQTGINCASGDPMEIVGFVCFEIREVAGAPDKLIRGRFLCPSDPLFDECDLGTTTTGGLDFGLRADIPVLVD
jgi:hypothetical protein